MRETSQQDAGKLVAKAGGGGLRDRWLLPGLLAAASLVIMTLLAGAVRVPGVGGIPAQGAVPALTVTRLDWLPAGGEARERLRLLDPAPLFMPGARASDALVVSEGIVDRPGGRVTETFPAALAFSNQRPSREILRPNPPRTPADAEAFATASRWFNGLARADASSSAFDGGTAALAINASGRLDVYRAGAQAVLASAALPKDELLDAIVWQPVELGVLINSAGVVASPVVTAGSGIGEIDERLRDLVTRELLPRLRLRPGAYRLVVGP